VVEVTINFDEISYFNLNWKISLKNNNLNKKFIFIQNLN